MPLLFGVLWVFSACGDSPPGRTYFERTIQPILIQRCAVGSAGCHATNPDDPYQFAAGNLDVTSFEAIQKRRDVLTAFGAYPQPLLLIKAVGPKLKMPYGTLADGTTPQFVNIDVQHSGGALIEVGSDAYFTLQAWLDNGATENGLKPATPPQTGKGSCSTSVPPGFNRAGFVNTPQRQMFFDAYKASVQPVFARHNCAAGNCHGAPQSDFYITCGNDDDQLAFNFSQAWSFVNAPVDDSQLLRVPLAVSAGGRGHTGGDQFSSSGDADFAAIKTWASSVGVLPFANGDPAKQFFQDRVQPILLQRGCSFQACHSPQATNDLKLRSGTPGFFSAVALDKNYDLLKREFMAMEFPDARRSRAVAKTILKDDPMRVPLPQVGGIAHRGGSVLEDQDGPTGSGADPADCGPYVAGTSSPFCTIQEWVRIERLALAGQVTPMNDNDPIDIVYIERATLPTAGRLEFDTFQGGADLKRVTTRFVGSGQQLQPVSGAAGVSLLGGCGLGASPDVQAPDVANDGTRVAFAARASASEPLGVFVVNIGTGTCTRITPMAPDSNGLKVHDFDPAWAPDGNWLVFASTRGKAGATRSRQRFLPQSDLWRVAISGTAASGPPEQMTFLSNSEIGPQFMREGRVTMTTEKVSDGFYQLSGRRLNWDLTDYHPLLAQRKDSPYADLADPSATRPSIGYSSATDIREGVDGSFLTILSNTGPAGVPATPGAAGALAVFNRSIGPFEQGRTELGYLHSLKILDASPVYRGPVSLPDGTIMVSRQVGGSFEIVSVNPRNPADVRTLITGAGSRVDAQLVYKYPARVLYLNRRQLVFGGSIGDDKTKSVVHMPNAPLLFTLLTGNLRRGRPVDAFRAARSIVVYGEESCPPTGCSPNVNGVYQNRPALGRVALADDGSMKAELPPQRGLVFELQDADHKPLITMTEEHQLGPGENITLGIAEPLFDAVCGGCHGSISGSELDVRVTPDALTGASASSSATKPASLPEAP
ncbi:MAG: PD40 domain-containing protein [Myxococcales bacterium]|nr:PD40 domain-containing protein [Myxococcales bacterium]